MHRTGVPGTVLDTVSGSTWCCYELSEHISEQKCQGKYLFKAQHTFTTQNTWLAQF